MNNSFSFNKLEVPTILEECASFAILPVNKTKILNLLPLGSIDEVQKELSDTSEALQIVMRFERAPIYISSDYDSVLRLIEKDSLLTGLDLYETMRVIQTVQENERLLYAIQKEHIDVPFYTECVNSFVELDSLYSSLVKSVDENGNILDSASVKLRSIRKKIASIDDKVKNVLQTLIHKYTSKLSIQNYTLRDDHYCLAVKSDFKGTFSGIVHDTSATNQTTFIEPIEVANLESERVRLFELEKEEIHEILINLTHFCFLNADSLKMNFGIIKKIDFIFAKALLGKRYEGVAPYVNNEGIFDLKNARHPLLHVAKVIPNSICFGKDYHGIIITGPNTGGKTVLLKTIGLIAIMVRLGLLIPADQTSNIMLFDQVFCDIGDDQSIQMNLSTFSSHMKNIVEIINEVTPNSLVLVDEIGSGTDPVEGCNLAKAILDYWVENQVSFITTTHYSELKMYAYQNHYVTNASMEFNSETLSPTYHLILGRSGASNAFSISEKLGLKKSIIDKAKKNTIQSDSDVRVLIGKLEKQSQELSIRQEELNTELKNAKEKEDEYSKKLSMIDVTKKQMLKDAQKEMDLKIDKIRKSGEDLIESLKKMKQDPSMKVHQIIEAKHMLNEFNDIHFEANEKKTVQNIREIAPGDDVLILAYNQYGVVESIHKGVATLSIGNIKMDYPIKELKLIDKAPIFRDSSMNQTSFQKTSSISLSLDLRGCRFEEAKDKLNKYFDDLLLTNVKQVTIIHGFGSGVIRELVQDYCRNSKYIDSFRYGGMGEGGLGATVVVLK